MEENKQNESFQHMESNDFTVGVLGVPTHFQNDGSALYLLTHALSPPSAGAVGHWLTQQSSSSIFSGIQDFLHNFVVILWYKKFLVQLNFHLFLYMFQVIPTMMRESQLIRKRHTVVLYHGILLPDLLRRILQKKLLCTEMLWNRLYLTKKANIWTDGMIFPRYQLEMRRTRLSHSIGGGQQLTILSMEVSILFSINILPFLHSLMDPVG